MGFTIITITTTTMFFTVINVMIMTVDTILD